ncbi:hypothetical protein [Arthrobacter echini]|uniref:hypothetical protein n=1 Tax=Arthrobacter echini TaxID=1529066 RepID=UPI0014560EA9|nr:hypothetical protein [Arthrobacter echini]
MFERAIRQVSWVSSTGLPDTRREFFARDGFHPSPAGHQRWARYVIEMLSREPGKR